MMTKPMRAEFVCRMVGVNALEDSRVRRTQADALADAIYGYDADSTEAGHALENMTAARDSEAANFKSECSANERLLNEISTVNECLRLATNRAEVAERRLERKRSESDLVYRRLDAALARSNIDGYRSAIIHAGIAMGLIMPEQAEHFDEFVQAVMALVDRAQRAESSLASEKAAREKSDAMLLRLDAFDGRPGILDFVEKMGGYLDGETAGDAVWRHYQEAVARAEDTKQRLDCCEIERDAAKAIADTMNKERNRCLASIEARALVSDSEYVYAEKLEEACKRTVSERDEARAYLTAVHGELAATVENCESLRARVVDAVQMHAQAELMMATVDRRVADAVVADRMTVSVDKRVTDAISEYRNTLDNFVASALAFADGYFFDIKGISRPKPDAWHRLVETFRDQCIIMRWLDKSHASETA